MNPTARWMWQRHGSRSTSEDLVIMYTQPCSASAITGLTFVDSSRSWYIEMNTVNSFKTEIHLDCTEIYIKIQMYVTDNPVSNTMTSPWMLFREVIGIYHENPSKSMMLSF
jgi:hypothetical protein